MWWDVEVEVMFLFIDGCGDPVIDYSESEIHEVASEGWLCEFPCEAMPVLHAGFKVCPKRCIL